MEELAVYLNFVFVNEEVAGLSVSFVTTHLKQGDFRSRDDMFRSETVCSLGSCYLGLHSVS